MNKEFEVRTDQQFQNQQSLDTPRDRRGRIDWRALNSNPEQLVAYVDSEIERFLAEGHQLSYVGLVKGERDFLYTGVKRYYPGGMDTLKEKFGIVSVTKPGRYWYDSHNIEEEARKLAAKGSDLSQRSLKEFSMQSMSSAVRRYPGGLQALREKLGIAQVRVARGYWQVPANIEKEARACLGKGIDISQKSLKKAGLSSLSSAIAQKYPGGTSALREKLGLPIRRPNGYWQNPVNVEHEVSKIIDEEGNLTEPIINRHNPSLMPAIYKHYEGGLAALRAKFGLKETKKKTGYWTMEQIEYEARKFYEERGLLTGPALITNNRQDLLGAIQSKYPGALIGIKNRLEIHSVRPKGYWTPDNIEREAAKFIAQHEDLNHVLLRSNNLAGFASAISSFYPGGMRGLRRKLGLEVKSRPLEFWTIENIVGEARKIYETEGDLSQKILVRLRNLSLNYAIQKKYPGGMDGLKRDIGIRSSERPNGYWTPETIEQEAKKFYLTHGTLDSKSMRGKGESGLSSAISSKYPGGFRALKGKFGVAINQRPPNYWVNPENIELELQRFLEAGNTFSDEDLKRAGLTSLRYAISEYYPGGMSAIREKYGLTKGERQVVISPDDANEQLRRLIED